MDYRLIGASFSLLLMCTWSALAQDYAFKVLATKGGNTIDGQPAKVGAKITDNQTVVVAEGAYLSLAHHSGKAIEVAAGSHKAKDLSSKIAQSSSMTNKYVKFVVNELTQEEQSSAAARNRFQHMNKTGSVERDLAVSSVKLWLPLNSNIMGDQLLVKWSDGQPDAEALYLVQISDLSDQVLFSSLTKDNRMMVDLTSKALAEQPHLIVKVLPVDAASGKTKIPAQQIDGSVLVRPESETLLQLQNELKAIREEFGANSAMGKLAEANFFEENGMIAEALHAYETALQLSGQVPSYQELYNAFLVRNDFRAANTAKLNK